jgi:excisionase family DNA binding protein
MTDLQNVLQKLDRIEKALLKKEKPFINVEQLSKYLGISRNTIYSKIKQIPHYKLGKKLMFKVSEIDEMVLDERNRIKTQNEIEEEVATHIINNKVL